MARPPRIRRQIPGGYIAPNKWVECDNCGASRPLAGEGDVCLLCEPNELPTHWQMIDGKSIKISDMDTGHLANSMRMLSERLQGDDTYPQDEKLMLALQREYDSRADEIAKSAGILRVLLSKADDAS